MHDSDLEFLRQHHAGEVGHTGGSLLDHLRGTAAILEAWGLPEPVVRAGLFHSAYGTDAFREAVVPWELRTALADRIGVRAEALAQRFCALDRSSLYGNIASLTAGAGPFIARDRHTGAAVELDTGELRDLLHLAAANWLEQRGRLDPAVRRARCEDYERMLACLVPAARAAIASAVAETRAEPEAPSLTELFAFADPEVVDRQCGELDIKYLAAVSSRLHERLAPELLERLAQLDDDVYLAILRTPEICYRLFADGDDLASYLDDALHVEAWRQGAAAAIDRPVWSAHRDTYLAAGASPGSELTTAPGPLVAPDRCYRAPVIDGVVIDLYSPSVDRPLKQLVYKRDPFGANEPFSPDEHALVLDRIAGALTGIERTNPVVSRFLSYTLHTIIPRKQTQPHLHPTSFKGSSTAATLHRANIYNIQQANVDIARLAQSMIHESVHNHLYKRELFEPTLIDDAAGEALRVTSPWSGNTLDFYVFVHSTIVYYALYQFFSQPAAMAHLPTDTVNWYRNRAVQGFASPAWATTIRTHAALIAPAVQRDLWAMHAIVTGAAHGVAA